MAIEPVDWGYELRPQSVKVGNKLDETIGIVNGVITDVNNLISNEKLKLVRILFDSNTGLYKLEDNFSFQDLFNYLNDNKIDVNLPICGAYLNRITYAGTTTKIPHILFASELQGTSSIKFAGVVLTRSSASTPFAMRYLEITINSSNNISFAYTNSTLNKSAIDGLTSTLNNFESRITALENQ